MPAFAKENGAKLVIINLTNTPFDDKADLLICGKAAEVMAEIIPRVKKLLIH
jgi:NAD-dependent SIR2 family protein deacetylase